jgi:uncharacterized RDD family membrane protein YckC
MAIEKIKGLDTVEFFKILSHELRIKIIRLLYEQIEMSYTEILNTLNLEEGNLNFHLRKMKDFVKINDNKTYSLSEHGKLAYTLLQNMDATLGKETVELENPSFLILRRTIAALIDFTIFLFAGVAFFLLTSHGLHLDIHTFHTILSLQISLQFTYIALVLMEAYSGQTIGKHIMKIRVVKTSGGKITLMESAVRNIGKVFFLPLDLLAGILFYRKKGFIKFSDYYTDTKVEKVL